MNLMFDECTNDPTIVEALNKLRSFNARCCIDCGFKSGQGDNVLVEQKKVNRMLVSRNIKHMNENKFPPGTGHNGLIAFSKQELTKDYVVPRLKAIFALKWDKKVKNNVVIIQDEDIELHTPQGSQKEVLKSNAKTKKLFKGN